MSPTRIVTFVKATRFNDVITVYNQLQILTVSEIATVKNINYLGFDVESDVNFQMKEDDSNHPSYINLLYLGAKNTGIVHDIFVLGIIA